MIRLPLIIVVTGCTFATALAADDPASTEDSTPRVEAHLFILSGQSNMQGHRPDEAFTPAVEAEFGPENVIVVQDALGGQPIQRWYKKWKSPEGKNPETTGDLNDGVNRRGKRIKDDLHYSAQGYKTFGKRMADAAIDLIEPN